MRTVASVLMTLALLLPAVAQQEFFLRGTVKDTAGSGVEGIVVDVWQGTLTGPVMLGTDTTDGSGYYSIHVQLLPPPAPPVADVFVVDTANYYLMGYRDSLVTVVDPETFQVTPTGMIKEFTVAPRATNVDFHPVKTAGRRNTVVGIYDALGRKLAGFRPGTDVRIVAVISDVNGIHRLTIVR